ncbi:MAG: undecaprenyl-diphosphate phosphatase [Endomicrobiales bacterium]|jgi:undecaprenyl-diphosphatase
MDMLNALILGIVEGLTEFLPISSTGHLILVGHWLSFEGAVAKLFEIFIQLGAILAVVWVYRMRILGLIKGIRSDQHSRQLAINLFIAFMPSAAVGLCVHHYIERYLFSPFTVAIAMLGGGIAIYAIENMRHRNVFTTSDAIPFKAAFWVGIAQVLSLFPGVSRSGSTIMGGLLSGMDRSTSTEFSFFLAIPTMFAATLFDLATSHAMLTWSDARLLAIGFIAAFISGLLVVKWLIRFVATHDFKPFAYYRIIVGIILLIHFS